MKKILFVITVLVLLLPFSCKKEKKESEAAKPATPTAAQPNPGPVSPAEPEGRLVDAESFFKFEVERLKINQEYQKKFLKLLKSTKTDTAEFEAKKKDLIEGISAEMNEVSEKHNIGYADLKKTYDNLEARQAFVEYRDSHPEIKKELEDRYQELRKLAEEINGEVNRLNPGTGEPSAPGPAGK